MKVERKEKRVKRGLFFVKKAMQERGRRRGGKENKKLGEERERKKRKV